MTNGPSTRSTSWLSTGWAFGWEMMPMLAHRVWPSTAAGTIPHDCHTCASAYSTEKSAGCAYVITASTIIT